MEQFKLNVENNWLAVDIAEGKTNQLYQVCQNAPLYFKMQDNKSLVRTLQLLLKGNPHMAEMYNRQLDFVKDLKKTELWIKSNESLIKINLYDVYFGLMKHFRDHSFEDQLFNTNEVSFVGPLGPFQHISLFDFLKTCVIEKLVLDQIVKNKLPTRSLRVQTRGKVRIEYCLEFKETTDLQLRQITDTGLLFSTDNDLILELITHGEYVKIFLDTRKLDSFVNNDLKHDGDVDEEFYYTKDELRYFFLHEPEIIKSLSYRSGETNEIFFFVRYANMLETDVPNIFHDFIDKMKTYLASL